MLRHFLPGGQRRKCNEYRGSMWRKCVILNASAKILQIGGNIAAPAIGPGYGASGNQVLGIPPTSSLRSILWLGDFNLVMLVIGTCLNRNRVYG